MKRKEIIRYAVVCFTVFVLMVPQICPAADMEIIKDNIQVHTDRRHSWNPWPVYNPDDDEFFVIWRTSGVLRDDCDPDDNYECTKSFQSIDAARISPDGEILGEPLISKTEGPLENVSWKMMPRVAYNTSRKEYMVSYYMVADVCLQCHDRNLETGEPKPADPAKCIVCHPGGNPGECNLVDFHDPAKGADCLSCHTDCVEESPPVPPTPHPGSCTGCHEAAAVHDRPAHTTFGNEIYTMRMDRLGNLLTQPERLYESPRSSGHPILTFNPERKQYLIGTADYFFTSEADNVGFIIDEDADILKGPIFFGEGSDGSWSHFLYYVAYNPIDDTYFIPYEDFRHATGAWYFGPNDIYGVLLDGEGNTLADIPIMDDSAESQYEQWYPCVAHNPDRNEFFCAWFDERPIVEEGGIVGRFFNSDGTPKGESFVVVDTKGSQGDVAIVYAQKHERYFIVYQSSQNFVPAPDDPPTYRENDIYAGWLDEDGNFIGDAIPIYIGEGDQTTPQVAYSPAKDRFLIVWWDTHAPDDYEPVSGETGQYSEISSVYMGLLGKGDVKGAVYGMPNPCAAREIYGEDSKEVELMRYARDNILNSTPEGQELIKLYYQLSPAIVKAMKNNGEFKEQVKAMIDGILPLLGKEG